MARKIQLLIIDPQNDFCDLPPAHCPVDPGTGQRLAPALPVPAVFPGGRVFCPAGSVVPVTLPHLNRLWPGVEPSATAAA